MSDAFVPLAALLRPPAPLQEALATTAPAAEPATVPAHVRESEREPAAAFGAARRFRAGVADALDLAVRRLLAEVAENVLARELTISGADIAAIVAKARERFARERVVAVRAHPSTRAQLRELEIEKIFDEALAPDDVILELRTGTIDLRMRARLEAALAAAAT